MKFDKRWFEDNQENLVRFTNSRIGRWFFKLNQVEVPKGEEIHEVHPNGVSFGWKLYLNKRGHLRVRKKTMFFTSFKISNRLYKAYAPIANILFATKGVFWDLWRQPASEFFATYRTPILKLARTDFGKWFFAIPENKGMDIREVRPNHLIFRNAWGKKAYEFRTNAKFWLVLRHRMRFAKALPYAVALPTMARLGIQPAMQMFPMLALATSYPTMYPDANTEVKSVDGDVYHSNASWATVRSATDGTTATDSATSGTFCEAQFYSSNYHIRRAFLLFDTSSIVDGDTIASATLSVYTYGASISDSGVEVDIVSSSPASNTAIVTGDFDQVGSTVFASVASASLGSSAYTDFSLDSNGIANISKTGVSKFGARMNLDTDNSAPTTFNNIACRWVDYTGTTDDPKLVVNTSSDTLSTFNPDADTETTSVDGHVSREGASESWSTIIAGAGTHAYDSTNPHYFINYQGTTSPNYSRCGRAIFLFDTSSITDGDDIDGASFGVNITLKADSNSEVDMVVVGTTPASNTALVAGDYNQFGSTAFSSSLGYSSVATASYHYLDLNASGLAAISDTGITKLGVRCSDDLNDTAPTHSTEDRYLYGNYAEGTSDPILIVIHSAAAATFIPKMSNLIF